MKGLINVSKCIDYFCPTSFKYNRTKNLNGFYFFHLKKQQKKP